MEAKDTDRINRILNHNDFSAAMDVIKKYEVNRIFCIHDIEHLLSVARIMYIRSLEDRCQEGCNEQADSYADFSKEIIYAAALLHDIGRARQYTDGEQHDQASARMADKILRDSGFEEKDIKLICNAILGHNHENKTAGNKLGILLKYADKQSRNCFTCDAYEECNWKEERKNNRISV